MKGPTGWYSQEFIAMSAASRNSIGPAAAPLLQPLRQRPANRVRYSS